MDKPADPKIIPLIWVYAIESDELGDVVRFRVGKLPYFGLEYDTYVYGIRYV